MQKMLKRINSCVCLSLAVLLCLLVYGFLTVPENYTQSETEGQARSIYTLTPMTVQETGGGETAQEYNALVKLFRTIPVKRARLTVGAVTHVFVNDPQRGYAIFAQAMAQNCRAIVETETQAAS